MGESNSGGARHSRRPLLGPAAATLLLLAALIALAGCTLIGTAVPRPAPAATRTARPVTTVRPTRTLRPAATTTRVRPTATITRATATRVRATATRVRATATPSAAPGTGGLKIATPQPGDPMGTIRVARLPREALDTIRLIARGGPFPYRQDGVPFGNRERLLPAKPDGYYKEYTVETPGSADRGARRLIYGSQGELYYTDDHYASFKRVVP